MSASDGASDRALELRAEFDGMFALPRMVKTDDHTDFLAVRVAGAPYLVRLDEVLGVHAGLRITALPGPIPELLGLAGLRGALVPVYSLAALFANASPEVTRWVLLPKSAEPLGLAVDVVERQVRVDNARQHASAKGAQDQGTGLVRLDEGTRSVIGLSSIVATIVKRCARAQVSKEK